MSKWVQVVSDGYDAKSIEFAVPKRWKKYILTDFDHLN